MTEVAFIKTQFGMHPENEETGSIVAKLKLGDVIQGNFSKMRNPAFHRKFMAMVRLGFEMWETEFENDRIERDFTEFRKWITVKAGFYYVVGYPDGSVRVRAKSLSWSKMDDLEFERVYNGVLNAMMTEVIAKQHPDYTTDEYNMAVDQMLSFV